MGLFHIFCKSRERMAPAAARRQDLHEFPPQFGYTVVNLPVEFSGWSESDLVRSCRITPTGFNFRARALVQLEKTTSPVTDT